MTDILEVMARAIEPSTFDLPLINLYKLDYARARKRVRDTVAVLDAAGYAIVPKEPTAEMNEQGFAAACDHDGGDTVPNAEIAPATYRAMIAAGKLKVPV